MFTSPTYGKRTSPELIEDIARFVEADPQANYHLIIGSDSHVHGSNGQSSLKLVTAIVVHRVGWGGKYFWQSQRLNSPHSIRDKIYSETLASLEIAKSYLPKINRRLNGNSHYSLEIHIDVGQIGDTRDMIKEVVGMVTGNGYTAVTKPDSYGASKIADKHT
ncbi:MAG: ribonuclease H-like YkuK family protein [Candidatus Beckwithbacteria bacterium]|nr:ribonuclease H-like YkuK family protein [Candidatus Beckwithbacteria bacterium]